MSWDNSNSSNSSNANPNPRYRLRRPISTSPRASTYPVPKDGTTGTSGGRLHGGMARYDASKRCVVRSANTELTPKSCLCGHQIFDSKAANLESVTVFICVFCSDKGRTFCVQKFVDSAVSATEIIHCTCRMMVTAAFVTHFSRVVKNILMAYSVIRLWPT